MMRRLVRISDICLHEFQFKILWKGKQNIADALKLEIGALLKDNNGAYV